MSDSERKSIEVALANVGVILREQVPLLSVGPRSIDVARLPSFFGGSPPDARSDEERARLAAEIERLSPWLQGPFSLGDDLLIEGVWRIDERWDAIAPFVGEVAGKRVLDVGSNAGYDPFMFHHLGAHEVLACEPFEFIAQARFLESVYQTGIDFQPIGWEHLDPEVHGRFDLVHCNGVLYHETDPVGLLQKLRSMVADGGELLLGSMMLADPTLSEYARFVRDDYAADPTWWWVPGRLALRRMMDAVGLQSDLLPLRFAGPSGDFPVVNGYFRGRPISPDPQLPRQM